MDTGNTDTGNTDTGNTDTSNMDTSSAASLKDRVCVMVEGIADELLDVSHDLWDHPELAFEEHHAHDRLCTSLEAHGLDTTRSAYGLDTAFVASAGGSGPDVGVICEYDALPGVGHACGHNIIAAAGLGAGIAAATVAEDAGGRVRVLGTPAEEGGGGKVFMAREGALEGLTAALMVHPADHDLSEMECIAVQQLFVEYEGRASHAAAAPEQGINALDAAVLGYVGVAALRQHIGVNERIHGVFTDGGDKPNIVPSHAAMHWYVRSGNLESLERLGERVLAALEAGALATGATITHRWHDPAYADMVTDGALLAMYRANIARLGRDIDPPGAHAVVGSTDMGNVSHEVPSIHPMIAVAPPGVAIHTADFATHARGEAGDRAVIDGAKALACTVVDAWAAAH
ncbi:MAG: M20 family metallopeptidase [Microthrixaceae bacterium]